MDEVALATALQRAQMGDGVAFGRIYQRFERRVFGLCRRLLGSRSAAEDATSEVFERAHRALDRYDPGRPFDRWLLTIASRHCLNRLRRERTERRLFDDEPLESPSPADSPLTACEDQHQRRELLAAIAALPHDYRVPLILRYYGDLSYDEIAEHLGITRNHVAVLLHRGKHALRRSVRPPGKEAS